MADTYFKRLSLNFSYFLHFSWTNFIDAKSQNSSLDIIKLTDCQKLDNKIHVCNVCNVMLESITKSFIFPWNPTLVKSDKEGSLLVLASLQGSRSLAGYFPAPHDSFSVKQIITFVQWVRTLHLFKNNTSYIWQMKYPVVKHIWKPQLHFTMKVRFHFDYKSRFTKKGWACRQSERC